MSTNNITNPFAKIRTTNLSVDLNEEGEDLLNSVNSQQNYEINDDAFSSLFENDDEDRALQEAKAAEKLVNYTGAGLDEQLEEKRRQLKKDFPMGGIKSSRFITTDELIDAPPEYFSRFYDFVKTAVSWVQGELSDRGYSGAIAEASENPTDEDLQDNAYRIVQTIAIEYLDKYHYRSLERAIILNMISNEIIGFGVLDPLWRDERVDEILCNGPFDIQIEIGGEVRKVSGVTFRDQAHIMALIERLYGAIGKTISRTTPIVDGRLHDFSRMAVVHPVSCPAGPNFSIRRHKEDYIPPAKLVEWGAASPEMLKFLGNLIYKGCSVLVIGGTSTGKTTLLGALSGFIRNNHRVLTLEDNLELKFASHKFFAAPMETVESRPDMPHSGVTMRGLVKSALRQRPDCIIVGEVRDDAAYDLCQALNTGHYGMSTVHANDEKTAIARLTSLVSQGGLMQGADTLPLIAASFDVIVLVHRFPLDGSRKIISISEVPPFPEFDPSTNSVKLTPRQLWKFEETGVEGFKVQGGWREVSPLSQERREFRMLDLEPDLSWDDLLYMSEEHDPAKLKQP